LRLTEGIQVRSFRLAWSVTPGIAPESLLVEPRSRQVPAQDTSPRATTTPCKILGSSKVINLLTGTISGPLTASLKHPSPPVPL
jgi:hypothetical protein